MNTLGFIIGIIVLFIATILMIVVVVYLTIKTEKIKKEFDKTMKIGDSVQFHVITGNTQPGIITKVDKDTVVIVTTVQKRFVYLVNKKKK